MGLLWIDGDHRYEAVKEDLDCWQPHLPPGAPVALHESTDPNLGPLRMIREAIESGDFEQVDLVRSTTGLRDAKITEVESVIERSRHVFTFTQT